MLVWLDCETTGLGDEARLLEVGLVLTDDQLVEQKRLCVPLTIPLGPMSRWATDTHTANGLLDACRDEGVPPHIAEAKVVRFLLGLPTPLTAAGSSVHGDLMLLKRWLPAAAAMFGHQVVDVTTLLLLSKRWDGPQPPKPRRTHRALDDCEDSIALLHHYRQQWLTPTPPAQQYDP